MVAFLRWVRSIVVGTLNGVVMFALFLVLMFVALIGIGLAVGDGMPDKILLTLDLRSPIKDSAEASPLDIGEHSPTVMDIVLALDQAGRDRRVKGLFMRVGGGDLSVPRAEEIDAALKRFRATGKFVIAQAQDFGSPGLGDYLVATGADEIWMQPHSVFSASGAGAGALFLRGLFDKVNAVPQIAKRSDFKSAADMYMEKDYTGPDRVQTTALLQSWYDNAVASAASARGVDAKAFAADLEASPQFADAALRDKLVDKLGYDDEAKEAAKTRAGGDNAKAVTLASYWKTTRDANEFGSDGRIALIEASGEIVDGSVSHGGLTGTDDVIAGDDLSNAIRSATADKNVKAILLRIDSPGGSVTASDQILDAVKKARAAGKPVVISMGALAASGGYYVACAADKIVAEPGTLTGSIGVLTGKVSVGKSLAMVGVGADEIGVGKNALFDSSITPYTPAQWAALNAQADAIYADFTQKVATGRKLPLAQVQEIAKGRVWTGADAKPRGLVDQLGGFWTAVADAKALAGIAADQRVVFKRFPERKGFFTALGEAFSGSAAGVRAVEGLARIEQAPVAQAVLKAASDVPRHGVEMRATGLPDVD
jgi:protease-4